MKDFVLSLTSNLDWIAKKYIFLAFRQPILSFCLKKELQILGYILAESLMIKTRVQCTCKYTLLVMRVKLCEINLEPTLSLVLITRYK